MNDDWEAFLADTVRRYGSVPEAADEGHRETASIPEPIVVLENASCGDRVEVRESRGGLRLTGNGCAICRASAAIATELVDRLHGDMAAIERVAATMLSLLGIDGIPRGADLPTDRLGDELVRRLRAFSLLAERPGRRRCASLCWEALREWTRRVDSR